MKLIRIGVIGLGYVGLPLSIEFAKKFQVIGYDINIKRIQQLIQNLDVTNEISKKDLKNSKNITFTNDIKILKSANYYIITVPTPIHLNKKPNLNLLLRATKIVGKCINKGDIVIYESTVYPGTTEETCVPILEKISKLIFNQDFFCGYSPERINPGDKNNKLKDIIKVVSGSNKDTTIKINNLYKKIIDAGTHVASSIKVAEAAKVIENTQRDLNIALVNELAIIFNKIQINTNDVLKAASTKWNFAPYQPGLVGGHCISVDPYYLTYKSLQIGYKPKIILAGRKLNDHMFKYVCKNILKTLVNNDYNLLYTKLLIMGFSFKENCSDIRNSQIIKIYNTLKIKGIDVKFYDPIANLEYLEKSIKQNQVLKLQKNTYDFILLSVKHKCFARYTINYYRKLLRNNGLIYDLKSFFDSKLTDISL